MLASSQQLSFERRLFRVGCLIGTYSALFFFFIHLIIFKEYGTAASEFVSFVVLGTFYLLSSNERRFAVAVIPLIILMTFAVDMAWYTSPAGHGIINTLSHFLLITFSILVFPSKKLKFLYIFFSMNFFLLSTLEFAIPWIREAKGLTTREMLIMDIMIYSAMAIGTFMIVYIKRQFKSEQSIIRFQNQELESVNQEIQMQNDMLKKQRSEIIKQHNDIEQAAEEVRQKNRALKLVAETRSQELVKLNQELDTLFYRSSHDFRGPLTTLMGLIEVSRLKEDPDAIKEILGRVKTTARQMDTMLNKFMMLSEISRQDSIQSEYTLNEIFDTLYLKIMIANPEAILNKKVIIRNYNERDGRNRLIEMVLYNLVENSITYSKKDQPAIVDLEVIEEDGVININVRDKGMGIPKKYRNKVFDMYFRGNEYSQGSGLGLYVVKKAVEALKGELVLDSKLHKRTEITVTFPVTKEVSETTDKELVRVNQP